MLVWSGQAISRSRDYVAKRPMSSRCLVPIEPHLPSQDLAFGLSPVMIPRMVSKEESQGLPPGRDRAGRLLPTGDCWCGCGQETTAGNFFASGHDKVAESAVIRLTYGTVAEFIVAHGYGPFGRNPRLAVEERRQQRGPEAGSRKGDDVKYGRTEADWDQLAQEGRRYLEERGRLEKTTSYTEMNVVLAGRTGLRSFDFDRPDERAAMGYLLGRITADAFDEVGAMLSALVQYLDENDAGPGFFDLAKTMGLLRTGATADERLEFWTTQVAAVHQHFRV